MCTVFILKRYYVSRLDHLSLIYKYLFCLFSVVPACLPPPIAVAETSAIHQALLVLKEAERPLVIIGKGKF